MSYTASYIVNSNSAQGTTDFTFTFPYIKEEHIEVYLNYTKLAQATGSVIGANEYKVITNVSPKLIRLGTGLASANLRVEIRRNSSLGTPLVDYADGSTLTAKDLDTSALQSLYIDQELKDNQGKTVSVDETTGLPTLNNLRLTNVGDPTAAQDAATKNYVDTTAEPKSAKLTELATMAQNTADALADLTATEVQAIDGLTASTDELNILDGVTATKDEINILDGVTATKDELNILDGVTATKDEINILDGVTATKDELNILDGVTATKDELNILDGVTATKDEINILDGVTATKDELNILDGVTATKDEINILDGVTATKDEINKLDGVTASTTEINKLDGLTATTTELNKLDGVTATTDELNKTDGLLATPTELNTLDGITSNTSELNKLDGVTASTTELNIVAGKTFKTSSGTLDTTSDTEIPSSKVIAAHVASSQTAIGGFTTIADEVSFPNTQPANGVVVSINNAAGVVINGSGVSTSGKRVDNTTVTINGFPSSLNGETLAAGVGLIVVSTSTANTYSYHKILTSETDVKQLSDDINDFNSRYRIAGSPPSSNNDEGDLYFDTAANKMKVYNGSAWDDVASVGSFFVNTLSSSSGTGGGSATFNGSAYRFTLSNAGTSAQQHIVSINGVIQKPNSGTSQPSEGFALDGNDIIFSAAPASGSDFFIVTSGSSVSIGTPSANSVNSSHIIDGSIVDGDISSSANIALSKLNTTGTASNSNYLRGDGAWSTIDLSTKANLSGATFTGDVVFDGETANKDITFDRSENWLKFNDEAKVVFGTTSNTTLFHNGTDLYIQNGAGDIRFEPEAGAPGLWLHRDGAIELYDGSAAGTPQKKLETTATGINVTGSISVNGSALSAAPEITGTASGSISANAAVAVKSDGNLEAVTDTYNTLSPPTASTPVSDISMSGGSGVTPYEPSWALDTTNKKLVMIWTRWNGDLIRFKTWGVDDTGTTLTALGAAQYTSEPKGPSDSYFDTNSGLTFHHGSFGSSKQWKYFTSDTETGAGTFSSMSTVNSSRDPDNGAYTCGITSGSDSGKFVIFCHDGNDVKAYVCSLASNGTLTKGNEFSILSSASYVRDIAVEWDSTNNKVVFGYTYEYSSGSFAAYVKVLTISSYSMTIGSETVMVDTSTQGNELDICHNPNDGKNYFIFRDGSNSSYLKGTVGVTASSGESITMKGSDTTHGTNVVKGGGGKPNSRHVRSAYNENLKKVCFWYINNSNRIYANTVSADSNNVFSFDATDKDVFGFDSDVQTSYDPMMQIWYHSQSKRIVGVGTKDSGKRNTWGSTDHGGKESNSNKFIGFADAAYTNGQTATVKVVGNTTTQSSLTPGTTYYVKDDGSLGTAQEIHDMKAGIALSSTKLLIKG